MSSFTDRLRYAFEAEGISMTELAARVGTYPSTVSDWLSKGALPKGEQMMALPDALGVNGHWLLTGRGRRFQTEGEGAAQVVAELEAFTAELRERWGSGHDERN